MNPLLTAFCCLAVALTSGHVIPHIPSGSVGVSPNGALVAGPAGSIHTSNGLLHEAGVQVAGPSGLLDTRAGHVVLRGPGHLDNTWGNTEEAIVAGSIHTSNDLLAVTDLSGHLDNTWDHVEEAQHAEDAHHAEEEHSDDGQWKGEQHQDWNAEEEKWNAEEEQWDKEENVEDKSWNHGVHKLVKRQDGRWNKELERYEITSPRSSNAAYSNNDDAYSPVSLPFWGHYGL